MPSRSFYGTYQAMCNRKKNLKVTCPFLRCRGLDDGRDMTFGYFWKEHAREVHRIKSTLECPFCQGEFKWQRKDLTSDLVNTHRMDCAKKCFPELFPRFKNHQKLPDTPAPPDTVSGPCLDCFSALDPRRARPRRDVLSGRPKVKHWGSFYREVGQEPPFLKGPFPPAHVSFSEASGLGDAMWPIVHQFLQNTHSWYHVSVRAAVWKDFEIHILRKKGVYVLPYWALCDGMKGFASSVPSSQRHHRHMVLVLEKHVQIEREWKAHMKIPNTSAKLKLCLTTIEYLINALFYVSNPHARCDGHVETLRDEGGKSHYYLHRRLYPHAKVAMHMLYRGGLQGYVDFRGRPRSARGWYQYVRGKGANRHIPVETLQIPLEGCALPFAAHLEPSHWVRVTTSDSPEDVPFVWLYRKDQAMVLRSNPSLRDLSFSDWYSHQMNRRNCFLNAVHDEKYVLGLRHRRSVNDMQWVRQDMTAKFDEEKRQMRLFKAAGSDVNVVEELQQELGVLRRQLERAKLETAMELDKDRRRLAEENCRLRRDLEREGRWADSVKKQECEDRIRQFESERNQMSAEMNALRTRLQEAHDVRIQQYEQERDKMSEEMKDLRTQLKEAWQSLLNRAVSV